MTPVSTPSGRLIAPDWRPRTFIVDVDGVMTNGQFLYGTEGKVYKTFGADDHDGLLLLRPHLEIHFVSGDRKGFAITRKRIVDDMGFPLDLVSTIGRVEWIRSRFDPSSTVYMGDGIFDAHVFAAVGYGICPGDGFYLTRERADFVTRSSGGQRAVAEACVHLLGRFFVPFDPARAPGGSGTGGEWGV